MTQRLRRADAMGTTSAPPSPGPTNRSSRPSPEVSLAASRSHEGGTEPSSWLAIPSHSPAGDAPPELASRPATSWC